MPSKIGNAAYWKANNRLIAVLLVIWGLVSLGAGIVFVEPLNRIQLGGVPLGFWVAQQGAIYTFIILIFVYAVMMDILDRRHQPPAGEAAKGQAAKRATAPPPPSSSPASSSSSSSAAPGGDGKAAR